MPVFKSRVVTSADAYQQNRGEMLALVSELRALEGRAVTASARRRATFESRGQIPPHERVAHLLDPGMPFLTIGNIGVFWFGK